MKMVGQCEGCHQRGRPKRKWWDSVRDAIREEGITKWLDSVRDAIREKGLKENGWIV